MANLKRRFPDCHHLTAPGEANEVILPEEKREETPGTANEWEDFDPEEGKPLSQSEEAPTEQAEQGEAAPAEGAPVKQKRKYTRRKPIQSSATAPAKQA